MGKKGKRALLISSPFKNPVVVDHMMSVVDVVCSCTADVDAVVDGVGVDLVVGSYGRVSKVDALRL